MSSRWRAARRRRGAARARRSSAGRSGRTGRPRRRRPLPRRAGRRSRHGHRCAYAVRASLRAHPPITPRGDRTAEHPSPRLSVTSLARQRGRHPDRPRRTADPRDDLGDRMDMRHCVAAPSACSPRQRLLRLWSSGRAACAAQHRVATADDHVHRHGTPPVVCGTRPERDQPVDHAWHSGSCWSIAPVSRPGSTSGGTGAHDRRRRGRLGQAQARAARAPDGPRLRGRRRRIRPSSTCSSRFRLSGSARPAPTTRPTKAATRA